MTITQAPNNLEGLILFDGKVFAGISDKLKTPPLELCVGNASARFEPSGADPAAEYEFLFEQRLNSHNLPVKTVSKPAETTPGEIYACWVNKLSDWTLSGRQTIQLMIAKQDSQCTIGIRQTLKAPETDKPLCFRALLATHRAQARLNVAFHDTRTGKTQAHVVDLDPAYHGGHLAQGYQSVSIPLPGFAGGLEVSLSVDYLGFEDDGTGTEPFIFIADARLASASAEDRILHPLHAIKRDAVPGTVWLEAPVPAYLAPGDKLELKGGQDSLVIYDALANLVQLVEDHGHTLVLRAENEVNAVLYIDAKAALRVHLGPDGTTVRLPAKYLDGCQHHVALKDATGTQTLLEAVILMPNILTPADVMQRESAAPFPLTLLPQTPSRYKALKLQMAHVSSEAHMKQLSYALSVLEGGYDNVKLKPLKFPETSNPDVSIIIPAHNKIEVTYLALCSLLLAYNKASFEVIVIDDASSDETRELESFVEGITVIHNAKAQRFIRACNAGAAKARGKYITLLNNDVEVTAGWLDELLEAFERFDNVGLAGSKLLYPTGELQDAGGIIWSSGNPWNYGNRQNPADPRFSYARQADYLSGAAMMVPAKVWKKVGGLSAYLEPMYFEDTDFAFKVREAGYKTYFVPSSIVYHYEGMTSGTDVTSGFKKFQEVNRPKFKQRWGRACSTFGKEGVNPDIEKDRGIVGRVLFIDHATPRPDQDAGSYAAIQEMRLVQSLGYKVSFLPLNLAHMGSYTEAMQKEGIETIYAPFFLSLIEYIDKHAADFDVIYLTRYYVAQDTLNMIRQAAPHAKILFNNADLHFLREIRTAVALDDPKKMEQARSTRKQELKIINKVDVVLSYNEVEHSVIQAYTEGEARIVKCPWVVKTPPRAAPFKSRKGISFLGGFRHHPNVEGVIWFAREIMPRVLSAVGDIQLTIYGSGMDENVKALKSDHINPQGFVADVCDAYDRHRIFVAPLLSGAGIKGKVLSALAHGIPCVLTPTAAEGIGLRHKHDCYIVEKPEQWAEAIRILDTDEAQWKTISENARAYTQDAFSFERGREQMRMAFEAADLFQSLT